MDINQPFVTQEQKFKYWEESKDEIQTLRAKVASAEVLVEALREAGQALVDRWNTPKWKDAEHTAKFIHALEKALSSTPTQSLAEHDNEVIEKCGQTVAKYANLQPIADEIRALKVTP